MNLRAEPGFLGTDASLLADMTLLAYVLLLLPLMAAGFYFARRKRFDPQHKYIMTAITLFNWILIIFVMAASYSDSVMPNVPDNLDDNVFLFPVIHLVTGGIAQLLATYLVLRMWLENSLPEWSKVRNIKLYMRVTLLLWVVTALLGMLIYVTWYSADTTSASDVPPPAATEPATPPDADSVPPPAATEEATADVPPDDDAVNPPATTEEAIATTEPATPPPPPPPPPPAPASTEEAESG